MLFPNILGLYVQVSMPSTGGNMPELLMIKLIFSSVTQLMNFSHYLKRPVLKRMADKQVLFVYLLDPTRQ